MGVSIGDLLLMIIGLILLILALIMLISNIMGQLYFFTLGPSRVVTQDISLRVLSAMASPGRVEMVYSNPTTQITYTFSKLETIFCVKAESQITYIKTIDCSSLPFSLSLKGRSASEFKINITKWFNTTYEKPEVKATWLL